MKMRLRFAPSPTGYLHIGTARTALFNWLWARSQGGSFILRIEDTDVARSSPEFESAIMLDLRWLGLEWDEGPDKGAASGPYRQSEKAPRYAEVAARLIQGGLAYHCFCTPEELETERRRTLAAGRMPKYGGQCRGLSAAEVSRRLAAGEQATLRFRVPQDRQVEFIDLVKGEMSFDTAVIGDFVLVRSDGSAGYNFAVVVDDMDMGITHVMRGEDHLTNTARHILLFEALDAPPPRFAHLSMIVGKDRAKLSKREGAVSVGDYRQQGYLPEALLNYLARLSWSPPDAAEILGRDEIASLFTVDRVSSSPAVFDIDKLKWLNGMWLRQLAPAEIISRAREIGVDLSPDLSGRQLEKAVAVVMESIEVLPQLAERLELFSAEPEWDTEAIAELSSSESRAVLESLSAKLQEVGEITAEEAKETMQGLAADMKEKGIKGRGLYHPVRIALTGCSSGPEIVNLLSVWGGVEAGRRLRKAMEAVDGRQR